MATMEPQPLEDDGRVFDDPDPDVDDFDAREAARIRRRDHDAGAHDRDLMRPGMGKVFKQITDSWSEKAAPDQNRASRKVPTGADRPR
jgi:hypothetical protein